MAQIRAFSYITLQHGQVGKGRQKMAEFTVIETQEQFDAAIKDRLNRERAKFTEQLAGYDETKSQLESTTKQVADLTEALTAANEKIAGFDEQIKAKDSEIANYATRAAKTQIAHEMGLSFDAIEFLKGDNEDEIRKSAESLKNLVGVKQVAPLASSDNANLDPQEAALRGMLQNLTN